ncbi:MAG: 1-(5-phosphoribosyl)-5-amino-4-imidazole-carboxylate carboxylase [Planctomycetota bacterium]|nr:MAG: 1-(5-phosphoribosyl)-5-amino-4-imidazole-carboxylate carboxylase [Planctomycetota bacterium]
MDKESLNKLLQQFKSDEVSIEDVLSGINGYQQEKDFMIDTLRSKRTGCVEVIFCLKKTVDQVLRISEKIVEKNKCLLATRVTSEQANALLLKYKNALYNKDAQIVRIGKTQKDIGSIAIVCAGTSDLSVAEEAHETALFLGAKVTTLYDCGVAGIHRLLNNLEVFEDVSAIVAVAGMEGALPSVVAGLVDVPVIAVPTSVGYGASFNGLAALLGMLNSCSNGISVVNIDNGFGGGYNAALIAKGAN